MLQETLLAVILVSTLMSHDTVNAAFKNPYSPPQRTKYHSLSITSTREAGTHKNQEPLSLKRIVKKASPEAVPIPFAADRRRKEQKKRQKITAAASSGENDLAQSSLAHPHGDLKLPIFCYYGSSANRRPSKGKFEPEDIDPFLCSHLIFAFVDISEDGKDLKPNNKDDLGPEGLYARTVALKEKNPKLKILLAVGGWKIGSKPFLPIIKTREDWKVWAQNVVHYLRRYGFDGFDMDWEFPGWRGSGPEDRHKFTLLMKDLHEAFAQESRDTGRPRLLLTMATAASVFYISTAYEAREIHKHIDYMLLMTYNFHGSGWEKHTGHPSPLLPHPLDPEGEQRELFVLWAVKYWLQQGVPKSKMVVGMPTYGLGWKLVDPSNTGVRAPADGGNTKGKFTQEQGILSHYEICEHVIQDGWQVEWIDSQKVPYAFGEGEWVGFESPDSFYLKAVTILKEGLGGAFIWSVEMDDFGGYCGGPRYPLLRTVNEVFSNSSNHLANIRTAPSGADHSSEFSQTSATAAVEPRSHTHYVDDEGSSSSSSLSSSSSSSSSFSSEDSGDYEYEYEDSDYQEEDSSDYGSRSEEDLVDIDCHVLGMGIHPDPESCQHFVMCIPVTASRLGPTRMSCPQGTRYDPSLRLCNHRHHVDCNSSTS